MFKEIYDGLTTGMSKPKPPHVDPLVAGMSEAIQQHESAAARLKAAMCKVLDGEGCPCIKIGFKQ